MRCAGIFLVAVSADRCEEIAELRRLVQQLSKKGVLILDETGIKLREVPRTTLVLPGNTQYVVASSTDKYALRYDMIACVHFNGAFTPMIISPQMRQEAGASGVTLEMFLTYINTTLANEVGELTTRDRSMIYDKSPVHSDKKVLAAFESNNVPLKRLFRIPTAAAKRVSPLDNTLFHAWKDAVRACAPLALDNVEQAMIDSWRALSVTSIQHCYHHCGFMRGQDPYSDCPNPAEHQH